MRFFIDDLEVLFPYDYIYPEQYEYMVKLKSCLGRGHCLLEMPTGTGKTVTLLSLILSYQYKYTDIGKLVYCTRTVHEMDKVVEELQRVMKYREAELKKDRDQQDVKQQSEQRNPQILGVCLSSRRNLCIHPEVGQFDNRYKVDAMCRNLTASFVREAAVEDTSIPLCSYYEGYQKTGSDASLVGVYSLDNMKELGEEKGWCPYFTARHLINLANVVVYNYQYMLDPKISGLVSKEIEKESIVVFDEAHNIDNICIEALSVTINKRMIHSAGQSLNKLQSKISQMQRTDSKRLNDEYKALVDGLAAAGTLSADISDQVLANPVLPADILHQAVPGNIRRAKHFVAFLKSIVEYIRGRLKGREVVSETPQVFIADLKQQTHMQQTKACKFAYDRLNSLLRTLKVTDLDDFAPLQMLTNFTTLVATYEQGFVVILEPFDDRNPTISDAKLQLCCLDASLAIKPVFERYSSVVITSGTLSPLDVYPKMLNFRPLVADSFRMSLSRDCICPLIVTKGSDQVPVSSKYDSRQDINVIQNYGKLVVDLATVVPDGIVCFFTSYDYMETVITHWAEMKVLNKILQNKLVFIETKDIEETSIALDSYKKACNCGRGAVFFSVARGKVAEGVDFDRHFGRAVIMIGVPFQYTLSRVLRARLEYLREQFHMEEGDFLTFDAIRQTSQCVGRVIRSKVDYGLMVFADMRYSRADKRNKLPQWITQYLKPENLNLSTDSAAMVARAFLRQMAQPRSTADDIGITMLTSAQLAEGRSAVSRPHNAFSSSTVLTPANARYEAKSSRNDTRFNSAALQSSQSSSSSSSSSSAAFLPPMEVDRRGQDSMSTKIKFRRQTSKPSAPMSIENSNHYNDDNNNNNHSSNGKAEIAADDDPMDI